MQIYGYPISRLIEGFSKLPGIGQKSAARIAFYILNSPPEIGAELAAAIMDAKRDSKYCQKCQNITDADICYICNNQKRDSSLIMVVETPQDMAAYEKTKEFSGTYHVLHGAISPMAGIGPDEIRIKPLLERVCADNIGEIILATNPNVEGEATAIYIAKLLRPMGIKTTRIAHGVPVGGDLEHVDSVTLTRALQWRREI
ncbi:MAG: recombination mediator RecR [Defluviitaleaceae bacterium]|nr:recombination mediator RecR [Defluviitaleaceae bacterium]